MCLSNRCRVIFQWRSDIEGWLQWTTCIGNHPLRVLWSRDVLALKVKVVHDPQIFETSHSNHWIQRTTYSVLRRSAVSCGHWTDRSWMPYDTIRKKSLTLWTQTLSDQLNLARVIAVRVRNVLWSWKIQLHLHYGCMPLSKRSLLITCGVHISKLISTKLKVSKNDLPRPACQSWITMEDCLCLVYKRWRLVELWTT